MSDIKFEHESIIKVKLDNTVVGKIKEVPGGWAYFPNGSNRCGETFTSQIACMESLYD